MTGVIDERRNRTPQRDERAGELRFASARSATVTGLVRHGMPLTQAIAWVSAWDESARGLLDFRRAPDFWELGYRYAVEERRRGYEPPVSLPSGAMPSPGLAVRDKRAEGRQSG